MVLKAWSELQEQQRQQLHLNGLATAELTSLLFNINRDPKKSKQTSRDDWALFAKPPEDDSNELPPVVAHVCIALRHEGLLPPMLVAIWRDVLKRSIEPAELPEVRALSNEERTVVVIAPQWEGSNLRGFLAAKGQTPGAVVALSDVDRPLMRYSLRLPERLQPVHFEAAVLLLNQEQGERWLGASSR